MSWKASIWRFLMRDERGLRKKKDEEEIDLDVEHYRPSVYSRKMNAKGKRNRAKRMAVVLGLVVLAAYALVASDMVYKSYRFAVTMSRPVWDKDDVGEAIIMTNLGWSGDPDVSCPLHNMSKREVGARMFDVFPVNGEWELLEIRLHELDPVVDAFVIFEMPCNFLGYRREESFRPLLESGKLSKFQHKIFYNEVLRDNCEEFKLNGPNDDMFRLERMFRREVQNPSYYAVLDPKPGDVFLFNDLDEIPRRNVARLLKGCTWSWPALQLELRNYRYSFEFQLLDSVYRSFALNFYDSPSFYWKLNHGRWSNVILADAGWHCSWCFGSLKSIRNKMVGYGHSDRLRYPEDAKYERILEKSCKGADPFRYDIEAYTFPDLIRMLLGIKPQKSAASVPLMLLQQPLRFRFLLPGGCRERPREVSNGIQPMNI